MQHAVEALEKASAVAERSFRRAMMLGVAAFALSLIALSAVAYIGLA
jgi:hypothetical protein